MSSSTDRPTTNEALVRVAAAVVALVAAVLGYIGFYRYLPHPSVEAATGWTDLLYYTLQLFLLDSAPLQEAGDLTVELEIARFLAPATTALALGLTAKAVYDSTYDAVRTRRLSDHTVVCGRGTPALLIARAVSAEGRMCVVVDASAPASDPHLGPAGDVTVLHLAGDPRDVAVLREARVDRAREVVVVTGDSARNADVSAGLRTALSGLERPPRCFLEMSSPELATALAAHEINSGSPLHLEFFDPAGRAARRLLDTYLPTTAAQGSSLLLIGSGAQHEAITADLKRRAQTTAGLKWAAAATADLVASSPNSDLAVVVVALEDDVAAVQTGLQVLRRLQDHAVDVVVTTRSSTALGAVISGDDLAVSRVGRARLHVFNTTEHVYSMTSLRDGVFLDMARAAHEAYVRQARARGESMHDNPSTVPWEQLAEHLQRSNVEQALAIGEKLRDLGCAVVPADGSDEQFVFEGAELERLARSEHERWKKEREDADWHQGPRDDAARTHPDLVPWDQLTEVSRQKDRDAVEAIPEQLRPVGLRIIRPGRS